MARTKTPRWRYAVAAFALCLASAAGWIVWQLQRAPSLAPYAPLDAPAAKAAPTPHAVQVRFAGVSTLVFDDGHTAWMTDGFFSRPAFWQMLGTRLAPDVPRIQHGLAALGVQQLSAVVLLHTHYDHAMDAPTVAQMTGATLIGGPSVIALGAGADLPPQRMQVVHAHQAVQLGQFSLQFLPSRHSTTPYSSGDGAATQEITQTLQPPQRASAWKEGQVWSLLVSHAQGGRWLVHSSAGFAPHALQGVRADTVFLGIGTLGKKDAVYRSALWRETVHAVGAQRVIPIHWDNFWLPLSQPLQAMPYLFDDMDASMQALQTLAAADHVTLHVPPLFTAFSP